MAAVIVAVRGTGAWHAGLAAFAGALAYTALLFRTGALRAADLELGRRVAATFRPRRGTEPLVHTLAPRTDGGRT
jgi:hypothetical protein